MSSFNGSISYEGGQPPEASVQEATRLAISTRALKIASGAPRITKAYDLDDGGQVYVLDMEHIWRVHIVQPFEEDIVPPTLEGPLSDAGDPPLPIAGVLSGATLITGLEEKEVSWPDVGQQDQFIEGVPYGEVLTITSNNISLVEESAKLFPRDQAAYKLGVPLDSIFSTVGDTNLRNQFHRVVPGNYTGAMAAIVQLLLGVGRIVFPDYQQRWFDSSEAADSRTLLYPSNIGSFGKAFRYDRFGQAHETKELLDEDGVPVFSGLDRPPKTLFSQRGEDIQIDYDYRWNRTHGVMWGKSNGDGPDGVKPKPMLVELAQRGIHVMPFPVDELSREKKVQDQYKKVYPKLDLYKPFRGQTQTLFEALEGFPTGEGMPVLTEFFDRWKRAGKVIAAPEEDLAEFYAGSPVSTGFGWAFHPSKPRAINTAYTFEDKHKVGYCYQVDLEIEEKPEDSKVRNPFLSQTIAALELTEEIDIFKAERLPESFAESMIAEPNYDVFDAFEVDPDWIVAATVTEISRGIIDYPFSQCPPLPLDPCRIIPSPHFKYYEPIIGEVFDFLFANEDTKDDGYVADGPIFATYKNSGVEILNYFYDNRTPEPEEFEGRQPCQFVGTWRHGSYPDGTKLQGYFYCTSRDFRKPITDGGDVTTVTAKRIGNADFIAFSPQHRCSFLSKHFFGTESRNRFIWASTIYNVAATVAHNNRSAFLICWEQHDKDQNASSSFTGSRQIGRSGTISTGWIYNFAAHFLPCSGECGDPSDEFACIHRICKTVTVDPDSCHGVEAPSAIEYSLCPSDSIQNVVSPTGTIIVSAYYTDVPTAPPAWSTPLEKLGDDYKWEIWAFGLDLMNDRKVNEGELQRPWTPGLAGPPERISFHGWWKCGVPGQCPSNRWSVAQNFFGKPFVSTYDDLNPNEILDFGSEPSVGFGPLSVPFGILD